MDIVKFLLYILLLAYLQALTNLYSRILQTQFRILEQLEIESETRRTERDFASILRCLAIKSQQKKDKTWQK